MGRVRPLLRLGLVVVDLAQGFAMGLAVLNGRTHVALGRVEGGSLWPGKPAIFRSGGAVASTGRYVVETAPSSVSLPVHVNGRGYLDVFRERTIVEDRGLL